MRRAAIAAATIILTLGLAILPICSFRAGADPNGKGHAGASTGKSTVSPGHGHNRKAHHGKHHPTILVGRTTTIPDKGGKPH